MSALEQEWNRKTGREKTSETRRKLPFLIKRLLHLFVDFIGFSRLVPGKQPLNLSIAYRTPGNAFRPQGAV